MGLDFRLLDANDATADECRQWHMLSILRSFFSIRGSVAVSHRPRGPCFYDPSRST